MKPYPIIKTQNISLRKLIIDDFENYYSYLTDEKIRKQFNFNHTKESAKERLKELIELSNTNTQPTLWAISLNKDNSLIGMISLDAVSSNNKNLSISAGITKSARGHGFAYEACKALIDYCFNNMDIHRIELAHNVDNISSQKTIEKLGAKAEGIARESKYYDGIFKDRLIYSILRYEWNN